MERERPRKRKAEPKLEFSPAKVFDVRPAEDLGLDAEAGRYAARKGQAGDRGNLDGHLSYHYFYSSTEPWGRN